MAREKSWECRQNIQVSETDDATTAQNWMFELYTFLSGGVGTVGKWEILSASQGSGSIGGAGFISSSHQFNWGASDSADRSWFVARKNILPVTASTTRYIHLTVDCFSSGPDDAKFYCIFDPNEPNFGSAATDSRPVETSQAYEQETIYRSAYDAGNATYFHATIDTTGSFHVLTAQQRGTSGPQYSFALSCARLETPRAAEVDPYPVFLKCGFAGDSTVVHGPWGVGDDGYIYYNQGGVILAAHNSAGNVWSNFGGQAMWNNLGQTNAYGWYCGILAYMSQYTHGRTGPYSSERPTGDPIDNTYALLPSFLSTTPGTSYNSHQASFRGRMPDVFMCPGSVFMDASDAGSGFGLGGLTIPLSGGIEYCVAGDCFLPFSASLQPGT
jgi:hypothetical protein